MFRIKHLMDSVDPDDGERLWVESIGLTKDLVDWCKVSHVTSHLGPPRMLAEWFDEHPDGYEFFRGCYHQQLQTSAYRDSLQAMACFARLHNITLLHQGDFPDRNTATALYEFLVELEAYCPPEKPGK